MSILYHDGNRQLQDRFDSRRISDRLEEKLTRTAFTDDDKAFIESAAYFFIATADAQGRPDCSFKGGMPGFVRVTGASELAFPDYDGNGMFKSLGNMIVNPNVGLLFIALHDKPKRLRVNGSATVSDDDPLLGETVGAQLIVRVAGARHLPQLPALYPEHADDRAVDLYAAAEMRAAGAGLEDLRQLQGRRPSARADLERLAGGAQRLGAPCAASTWWICATTAAPSPIAAPTRLVEAARTSPMANTPGMLVSSGSGARPAAAIGEAVPGHDKSLAVDRDAVRQPLGVRIGADEQEQMTQRITAGLPAGAVAERRARQAWRTGRRSSATTSVPVCSSTFGNALMRSIR